MTSLLRAPRRALLLLLACSFACGRPVGGEAAAPRVELLSSSADVWAFRTALRARAEGARSCAFLANERAQPAELRGVDVVGEVVLDAGKNLVSVECTGARGERLRSSTIELTVRLRDAPRARAKVTRGESGVLMLDASESLPREESDSPLESFRWTRVERSLAQVEESELGSGARLNIPAPESEGELEFAVHVRDRQGREDRAHALVRVANDGSVAPVEHGLDSALEGATAYGIVPPLYGEPPFESVIAALDGLRDLGVRALWLSPLFATVGRDFGYAVTDPLSVRPDYGDADTLRRLIREAHARGLRVLFDLVPNHTSNQHPYYLSAREQGVRSHYYSYYQRNAEGEVQHYFDWEHLPNLNYDSPEVQNYALAFSRYWVEQFDIDGYRVDAAWGVRQRRADFYPRWSDELRRVKPRVFLLAEASARDPYYVENGFDAAYDWTGELGHHAWEHVFGEPAGIAKRLAAAIAETNSASPEASRRTFRFLNNNDTGQRFITKHGEALTRAATAALLTLPGIPCLYALDEVGAEYHPYEAGEPRIAPRQGLREYHRTLIALRANSRALASGEYRLLAAEKGELFAFLRRSGPRELAVVAINFGATPIDAELTLPDDFRATPLVLRDALMGGARRVQSARVRLRLLPWDVVILLSENESAHP